MAKKPVYLSQKKFLALARKAIKEKGADYVYQKPSGSFKCVNFDPKTAMPSCIIGHIYADLGITIEDLDNRNAMSVNTLVGTFEYSNSNPVIITHPRTKRVMREVQRLQDRGYPWGESLKRALKINGFK